MVLLLPPFPYTSKLLPFLVLIISHDFWFFFRFCFSFALGWTQEVDIDAASA